MDGRIDMKCYSLFNICVLSVLSLHNRVERSLVLFVLCMFLSFCRSVYVVMYVYMFVCLCVVVSCVMSVHSEREMSRKAWTGRKWDLDLVWSQIYMWFMSVGSKSIPHSIAIDTGKSLTHSIAIYTGPCK